MTAPDAPASSTPPAFRWEFEAIGTRWRIDTAVELSATVRSEVGVLIDAFDRAWSRFRPDAEIAALATAAGSIPAPVDAAPMLDLFLALSEATAEAVNPLIGDALARRGYDAQYGLVDHGAQAAPAGWSQLLTWGGDRLTLRTPATIDVGALGKGRLVDRVLRRVAAHVEGAVTVDAGGDIALRGSETIALEHPFDPTRAIGVWRVTDAALCASAIQRRAWPAADGGGLHHVLDARTGEPVRTIAATWVVAADAMTADAAATALFFDGGPAFADAHAAAWVRMTTDGRVEWSPDSKAELFL
ncbi:FAD:protein FMN transferase [Microbacterium laevaniformans]|uniref:FAD:protein FMN transferase n=1 Tax=Microbacterium laevaniformans TaxID=36807 RepID=A0A4S2D377_9MICO|nr:FAD:protein FMN transferase [Microbacterium laevaniformans]TGY35646.1 FAD:protein FMN transferase [Microbacterium laevaniformans]